MEEFFDIEKLDNYKGWLKKITQYFNYEKVNPKKIWDFLSEQLSFNGGEWYNLKLSLLFLYTYFHDTDGQYDELDKSTILEKINDFIYDDYVMALSGILDVPLFLMVEQDYGHYGYGKVFIILTDDSEYVVYSEDDIDEAYDEWKESYMEDIDLNDLYNIESYLDFDIDSSGVQNHISEEVDYILEDKTDDEILEIANMVDEKEDLERQINKLKKYKEDNKTEKFNFINDIKLIDSQIYDLEIKNDEGEYDEKIENLELEKEQIEELIIKIDYDNVQVEDDLMDTMSELDDLIEYKAREIAEDILFDDISNDIDDDPIYYFFTRLGYDYSDIVRYGYATFAYNDYKENMFDDDERGHNMNTYDSIEEEIEHNGKTYYIHRLI
jgi:hypothetical protein